MAPDREPDLEHRVSAAASLNRLSHALVRHRADPGVLRAIAREADRLAIQIEAEPIRERLMELVQLPTFDEALQGNVESVVDEGTAFLDVFSDSPVSGSANPLSIGLRIRVEADEAVGQVTLGPGWQGAPGRSHGGVVAAVVDEVFGALLTVTGEIGFTGELTVRYEAPCPLGVPLEFRARSVGSEGRKLFFRCEGSSPEGVFVTSRATFITINAEDFAR